MSQNNQTNKQGTHSRTHADEALAMARRHIEARLAYLSCFSACRAKQRSFLEAALKRCSRTAQ